MRRLTVGTLVIILLSASDGYGRKKRQLMFPPQSIMQLAFAVVTPAEVKNRQMTTNMGVMFNIELPTNVSSWYPWRPDYRRRSVDVHHTFYSLLQNLFTLNGLDGKACLYKSVCQMRESPVHSYDLPHQLINLIFGYGQRHTAVFWEPHHQNTTCDLAYPNCPYTPVDLFLELYTSSWNYSE